MDVEATEVGSLKRKGGAGSKIGCKTALLFEINQPSVVPPSAAAALALSRRPTRNHSSGSQPR